MFYFFGINIYALAALLNIISALFFGLLIFLHNPKNRLYQTFFLLNLSIGLWSFGYFFWQISNNKTDALFWTRVLSIGSTLIPPTFLHWTLSLLSLNKKYKKIIIYLYLISFSLVLFGFSNYFVKGVERALFFNFWPQPGILYSFYLFLIYIPVVFFGNYIICKTYRKSQGLKRSKLKVVFYGTAISFLGGTTNFPLWYNVPVPPIGNFFVSLYPLFFAYSIMRYRFMDIKSLINRSISFGILILIITGSFVALSSFIGRFFEGVVGIQSNIITGLVVGFLVALFYDQILSFLQKATNKLFFKKVYDKDVLLSSITEITASVLTLGKLLEAVSNNLIDALQSNKIVFALINNKKKLEITYTQGIHVEDAQKLADGQEKILYSEFKRSEGKTIVIDELVSKYEAGEYEPLSKELMYGLHSADINLVIPLYVKDALIGVIALGTKKSGDLYSQQDLNVLDIIAGQTGIAIENAQLYDEMRDFNAKLQQRVEEATRDLRIANAQLRELDKTKSEFISIASHQLRTPLTVIKGYISMTQEGSFGKVPPKIMDNLKKVYAANERLIGLVENLLDISRIEAGRQKFEWGNVHIENMAETVVEELSKSAKDKGLHLTYHKPEKALPEIYADQNKLHEVMMNFVDNAIKYTKEGKIDVALSYNHKENTVTFAVSDTGMGVAEEVLPYLFKKFSRGEGSFKVHTEGTGLGLYVARMIVEAHHGIIGVETPGAGKGSRFFFTLPITGPKTKNYKADEPVTKFIRK